MSRDEMIEVVEVVCDLAHQLASADLRLRERSLAELAGNDTLPSLLVARRMRAELRVEIVVTDEDRLFWIFTVRRDAWRAAEGRVRLEVEPVREQPRASDPLVTIVIPPILAMTSPDGPMALRMPSGRVFWARIIGRKVTVAISGGPEPPPDEYRPLQKKERHGAEVIREFLQMLREWAEYDRWSPAYSLQPTAEVSANATDRGMLARLLGLARVYLRTSDLLGGRGGGDEKANEWLGELARRRASLQAVHPSLAGYYRAHTFEGSMAVWLTSDGRIANHAESKRATKLGFGFRAHDAGERNHVGFRPSPADVLRGGETHERLAELVKERFTSGTGDAADVERWLIEGTDEVLFQPNHADAIRDYFGRRFEPADLTFYRTKRKDDDEDHELALIEAEVQPGHPAWMIFELLVADFGKPGMRLSGSGPLLLAGGNSGSAAPDPRYRARNRHFDRVLLFIHRMLWTLDTWRRVIHSDPLP